MPRPVPRRARYVRVSDGFDPSGGGTRVHTVIERMRRLTRAAHWTAALLNSRRSTGDPGRIAVVQQLSFARSRYNAANRLATKSTNARTTADCDRDVITA